MHKKLSQIGKFYLPGAGLIAIVAIALFWTLGADPSNAKLDYIVTKLGDSRYGSSTNFMMSFKIGTAITTSTGGCVTQPCGYVDITLPTETATGNPYFVILDSPGFFPATFTIGGVAVTVASTTVTSTAHDPSKLDKIRIMFNLESEIPIGTTFVIDSYTLLLTNPAKQGATDMSTSGIYEPYGFSAAVGVSTTEMDYGYTLVDGGATKVAIGENIGFSAQVSEIFTFTVGGMTTSTPFGEGALIEYPTMPSTSSTCSFGTLVPSTPKTCGQTLTMRTNAANGYTVFLMEDHNMQSGVYDIDKFSIHSGQYFPRYCSGYATGTNCFGNSMPWVPPMAQVNDENTYGHLGYSSDDTDVFTAHTNYAAITDKTNFGTFSNSSPVMATSVAGGGTDVTHAKLKIEISALQEAGHYVNQLWYVAVPIY